MGSLEYAQARLSARFGARPDEAAWRRIEHLRELPALIDAARTRRSVTGWPASRDERRRTRSRHPARALARAGRRGRRVDARRMAARGRVVRGRCRSSRLRSISRAAARPGMDGRRRSTALWRERDRTARSAVARLLAPLATAWSESDRVGAWASEWQRRLPPRAAPDAAAPPYAPLAAHLAAFRDPATDGDAL